MRQQTVNGRMRPIKGAPNPMQRLSRFPAAPHISPLRHRKFHVFPLRHRHHLGRKIYIRWCCIDLLNAPCSKVKRVLFRGDRSPPSSFRVLLVARSLSLYAQSSPGSVQGTTVQRNRGYLVQRWWEIILSITLHFPDDTRRFNSSNQFSTTLICGLLSFVIIKKRWPSGDTS